MAISIGDAVLHIGADTSKLDRSLKGIGDKLTSMGKNLTMKVTAPLVGIGIAAFKMAGDFDQAFRKVNVMLGASTEEAIEYKKRILEISSASGKAGTDVADAFYQIVSAGYRGADALDILDVAMRGAVGGAADTVATTEALTKAMNIFELEGVGGATRAMDVFFGIVDTGLLTFEELANSFPRAATMAAGLGVSIEETGAALGTLTKVSGSTEQASTALNAVFTQLVKPSEDLRALYEKWGVKTGPEAIKKFGGLQNVLKLLTIETGGSVDSLAALFPNVEAIRAILPLTTTNAQDFADALDTVTASTGKTDKAFDEMATGPGFQFNQLMTNLKNAGITLGDIIAEKLGPALENLIEWVKGVVTWFGELSDGQRGLLFKTIGAVALLGPLMLALGFALKVVRAALLLKAIALKVVTVAQWLWNAALMANPIGLVIVGIVALGAAMAALGVLIHRHWDGILSFFKRIGEGIKTIFLKIAEFMYEPIRKSVDWIINVVNGLIRGLNRILALVGIRLPEITWRMPDLFANQAAARALAKEKEETRLSDEALLYKEYQRTGGMLSRRDWIEAGTPLRPDEGEGVYAPNVLEGYARGGPILEPTLLYGMKSKRVYAQAHTGERVTPGGGGYGTLELQIFMDGDPMTEKIAMAMVDKIRLRTGVQY